MAKFRHLPLINKLVAKYFDEEAGWLEVSKWDTQDIIDMELFANAELQRRAAQGAKSHGNSTVH